MQPGGSKSPSYWVLDVATYTNFLNLLGMKESYGNYEKY